jgi:hypothetical protein
MTKMKYEEVCFASFKKLVSQRKWRVGEWDFFFFENPRRHHDMEANKWEILLKDWSSLTMFRGRAGKMS